MVLFRQCKIKVRYYKLAYIYHAQDSVQLHDLAEVKNEHDKSMM